MFEDIPIIFPLLIFGFIPLLSENMFDDFNSFKLVENGFIAQDVVYLGVCPEILK